MHRNKRFLVSVLVITYNQEKYIRQAIENALAQVTDFNFEIVIGDDCSTDSTNKILTEYKKRYPDKIRLLLNEKNLGMMQNFVNTYNACDGKYIALCEGDDFWTDPFKLQKQVNILEDNPGYSFCFHEVDEQDENGNQIGRHNNINETKVFNILDLTQNNFVATCSVVFRNTDLQLPDNFVELNAGDWALHILNAQRGDFIYLPDCMGTYRILPTGAWNSMSLELMGFKGIEVMLRLNEMTKGNYKDHFYTGIKNRFKKFSVNIETVENYKNNIPKEVFEISKNILGNNLFDSYKEYGINCLNGESTSEAKTNCKEKLKAIIVVYYFPKLSETFILDQITGLLKQGIDIEIWSQAIPEENLIHPAVIENDLLSKTRYIQFPANQLSNKEWKEDFLRINKVNLNENDLFHVHFGQNFIALQKLFSEIKNPVIVSFHGLDASEYIQQNGTDCYNDLFKRVDLITTPSFEMQNVLLEIGSKKEKMIVHRYGVDVNKFIPKEKPQHKEISILTVARLVEKKGIEYSIRAFAEINSDKAIYKIIGEGPLEAELKKLVGQLGINDKVIFLGPKSRDEIIKEMCNADIYVLTSVTASNGDKEGLPVTLIEAQSTGLPVISTFHGGIPELVNNNRTGFLCEEKNIKCIAEKLDILIKNPEVRNNFASIARVKVLEEFDITKLNKNLFETYQLLHQDYIHNITGFNGNNSIAGNPAESESYYCPICNTESAEFLPYGLIPRPNVMCPSCGSLERHRLLWLLLENDLKIPDKKINILHIAPEDALANKFRTMLNINYVTIDLIGENVQYKMDVQDLKFSSDTFDIIICNHVLEHVYDDIQAIKEFLRVLKPGGKALLQVPIFHNMAVTIDGRNNNNPEERSRLFGQADHLRAYGTDFKERLKLSGFSEVEIFKSNMAAKEKDTDRLRLSDDDILFICRKSNRLL